MSTDGKPWFCTDSKGTKWMVCRDAFDDLPMARISNSGAGVHIDEDGMMRVYSCSPPLEVVAELLRRAGYTVEGPK